MYQKLASNLRAKNHGLLPASPRLRSSKRLSTRICPPCASVPTENAVMGIEAAKVAVKLAVSNTARGKNTTPTQRSQILERILSLEAVNPTASPASSDLISGMWALLYQAPLSEEKAAVDKSGTTEGPFLAAFQPLTRDLIRTKNNLQLIDLPNQRIENLAEFTVAGRFNGYLNIVGRADRLEPAREGDPYLRVGVEFIEFSLRIGKAISLTVPLSWVKAKGWIETTFLDEEMRVGRGDKGSIFVASKIKGKAWPALPK